MKTKIRYIKESIITGKYEFDKKTKTIIFDAYSPKDLHKTLHLEISLTEFSEVMHGVLEQRREEKTSTDSTTSLGKETLEEQNDTTEKDKTEKTMSEQIRMANKEEQIKN